MYGNAYTELALYISYFQSIKSHVSDAATTPSLVDNLAGVVVNDSGQIAKALLGVYLGNVGAPAFVRFSGFSFPGKLVVVDAGLGCNIGSRLSGESGKLSCLYSK